MTDWHNIRQAIYDIRHDELADFVATLVIMTYLENSDDGPVRWNPDKEWSGADYLQEVCSALDTLGLVPPEMIWASRPSKFVKIVQVQDPDTGNVCEVEIRKLPDGSLVGFDGAYLGYLDGIATPRDNPPLSPYDGTPIHIPDDEERNGEKIAG